MLVLVLWATGPLGGRKTAQLSSVTTEADLECHPLPLD